MKVLMLNGSAKSQGNTYRALYEVGEQLKKEGIDYEIFQIGADPIRDCIGCGQCGAKGCCIFDDDKVNLWRRQKRLMDSYLDHLYTMLIQVEEYYHSLTGLFIVVRRRLSISRAHQWQLQDVAVHRQLLMY